MKGGGALPPELRADFSYIEPHKIGTEAHFLRRPPFYLHTSQTLQRGRKSDKICHLPIFLPQKVTSLLAIGVYQCSVVRFSFVRGRNT